VGNTQLYKSNQKIENKFTETVKQKVLVSVLQKINERV